MTIARLSILALALSGIPIAAAQKQGAVANKEGEAVYGQRCAVCHDAGGLDGHLRAYSAEDGRILWDVDTQHEFKTVNGVPGHGGSLDGPGAVIVGGTLYVNSGYAFVGGAPGNVLLAFSVDGK